MTDAAEVHQIHESNPIVDQLERCKAWLEEALDGDSYRWEDVIRAVFAGKALFWPGKNCAMVTEDQVYPNGDRAMLVWLAGGDMAELLEMAPGVEASARLRGCSHVLIEGRMGWAKVLKSRGYGVHSVMLKKGL